MKNVLTTVICLVWTLIALSQTEKTSTFPDTVKKHFDYKKLSETPCKNAPTGIYAVTFRIGKNHLPYGFIFSNDTLIQLKQLFIEAIKAGAKKTRLPEKKEPYLQLCYLNSILLCDNSADSSPLSNNIYSDLSKLQGAQLKGIENSFEKIVNNPGSYFILPVFVIDNSLNNDRPRKGVLKDTPDSKMTDQRKQQIDKLIQERKNN